MTLEDKKALIEKLEDEAQAIHSSTRVDIPLFSPVHNYLRSKSATYYKWSISRKSSSTHLIGISAFAVSLVFFIGMQIIFPDFFSSKPTGGKAVSLRVEEPKTKEISYEQWKEGRSYIKDEQVDYATNTTTAKLYSTPVQYLDNDGVWKDIDTNIKGSGSNLSVKDAPYKAYFSSNPTEDLRMNIDGYDLYNAYLDGQNNGARIEGNKITYTNAYQNTDIERIFSSSELKQNIVLKEYGHPTVFKEKLVSPFEIRVNEDNSISYYKDGKKVATTVPIKIVDANGITEQISLTLENNVLSIALPETKFLAYPLVIDPSTNAYVAGTDDTYINMSDDGCGNYWVNANYPTATELRAVYNEAAFVRFPFSAIPGDITAATMNLYASRIESGYSCSGGCYANVYSTGPYNMGDGELLGLYQNAVWYGNGNLGATSSFTSAPNWITKDVSASVLSAASNNYAYAYFMFVEGGSYFYVNSGDNASNKPYLAVTHTATPPTPTSFSGTPSSPTSITWNWTDRLGETGYRVHDANHNNISGDLAAGTTSWVQSGLAPNSGGSMHLHAFNVSGESPASPVVTRYTLAADPGVSETTGKTANNSFNITSLTFQSTVSFGQGGVQYYRYALDHSATHTWTGSETQWSSGAITLPTLEEGPYYLHLKSYNGENTGGGTLDVGPFTMDHFAPQVSGLKVKDNTTGAETYSSGRVKASGVFADLTPPTTIDAMESTAGWSGTTASISQNTSTFYKGAAALNLLKVQTSSAEAYIEKTLNQNTLNKTISVWAYIKDQATLNKSTGMQIYLVGSGYSWYIRKDFPVASLHTGWNLLSFNTSSPDGTVGSPNLSSTPVFRIDFDTINASQTTSAGDVVIDEWGIASSNSGAFKVQFSDNGTDWGVWNGSINNTSGGDNWSEGTYLTITASGANQTIDNGGQGVWNFSADGNYNLYVRVSDGVNISGKTFITKSDFSSAYSESIYIGGLGEGDYTSLSLRNDSNPGVNTYLLWNGASPPNGWAFDDSFNGRLIRGNATGRTTGGADTHTHTTSSWSSPTSSGANGSGKDYAGSPYASGDHNHNVSALSFAQVSSFPDYRGLRLIKFTGVPTTIPSGAIAFFQGNTPNGWSRYAAGDSRYIMLSATPGSFGGANSHTHNGSGATGAPNSSNGRANAGSGNSNVVCPNHTHDLSGSATGSGSNIPPSYSLVMATASSNIDIDSSPGLVAMFDTAPNSRGWENLSASSGVLNQKFPFGHTAVGLDNGGTASHAHSGTITTAQSTPCTNSGMGGGSMWFPASNHWHNFTYTANPTNNSPSYVDFIFAKRNTGSAPVGYVGKDQTGLRVGDPSSSTKYKWQNLGWSATGLSGSYRIGFQVRIGDNWGSGDAGYVNPVDGSGSYYYISSGDSGSIPISSAAPESKTLEIRMIFESADGQNSPRLTSITTGFASSSNIIVDKGAPNSFDLTAPVVGGWGPSNPTFEWQTATDDLSGISKYQLFIDGNLDRDNIPGNTTTTTPVTPLSDGSHNWYIKAFDGAGNSRQSSSTWNINVDTNGPVITDNQNGDDTWRKDNNGTYNIDFADSASGLEKFETKVTDAPAYGGTVVQDWMKQADLTGSSHTNDFGFVQSTWDAMQTGTYYIYVRAYDMAGNVNTSADYVFYVKKDRVEPSSVITTNGYYSNARPWPGNISGTSADTHSGPSSVKIRIKDQNNQYWTGSWGTDETWQDATGGANWTYDMPYTNLADNITYTVETKAVDVAGNEQGTATTQTFTYDTLKPTGTVSINNGNAYAGNANVNLLFSNVAGDVVEMKLSNNSNLTADGLNGDSGNWIAYAPSKAWAFSASTGTKTVYVTLKDQSGNESEAAFSDSIVVDLTAPTSTITSPSNGSLINLVTTISGTATDADSGISNASGVEIAIIKNLSGTDYYWNGSIWDTNQFWLPTTNLSGTKPNYTWARNVSLPDDWANSIEQAYRIRVKARDDVSNQGAETQITFNYDKVSPAVTSLSSVSHPNQNSWYNNGEPQFSWGATDANGVAEYSYVFDHTSDTDINDATPGKVNVPSSTTTKSYVGNVQASGLWYFHVEARDNAGNWSAATHRTVRIDTAGPVQGTPPFAANGVDDTKIELNWGKFVDAESGVKQYRIYRSTTGNTPQATGTTDPGINPASLTYPNAVTTVTDDGSNSYTHLDQNLAQGWYYYAIYVDDLVTPLNTSSVIYSYSKTNFVPDNVTLTINGGGEVTFNPQDTRAINLSWDSTDPDGRADIVTTKFTVKNPDGTVLATFDQNNLSNVSRTEINNGYHITGTYTIPADAIYGNYSVYATTIDMIALNAHTKDSNTVQVKLIPASPAGAQAAGYSSVQINLSWQAPQYADGTTRYEVFKAGSSDENDAGWSSALATDLSTTSYASVGLVSDTTYYYRIKTIDGSGNRSSFSETINATTPTAAGATNIQIKDVSATTEGQVDSRLFTWWDKPVASQDTTLIDVPENPTYVIYRSENGVVNPNPVAETTNQYYLDVSLNQAVTYGYRIHTKDTHNNLTSAVLAPLSTAVLPGAVPTVSIANQNEGVSSVTIVWDTNIQTDTLIVYGNQSGNYTQVIGAPGVASSHTLQIKGLVPDTTYYYKVIAKNPASGLQSDVQEMTFRTQPFTLSAVDIKTTSSSATFSWNTNIASTTQIEYQKQGSSQPSRMEGSAEYSTDHSYFIKNLSPGAYSYKLRSFDPDGNYQETALGSFEIPTSDQGSFSDPQSAKVSEKEITATSAKITWESTMPTTSWVDFGTSTGAYNNSTGDDNLTRAHVVTIENLVPDTTYYYRIRGIDANGLEYKSGEYTFKALAKPLISDLSITKIGAYSATVTFSTNIKTQAGVNYGESSSYGNRAQSQEMNKQHSIILEDLQDGITYHLQVDVTDEYGNSIKSEDKTFSTPLDTTPPVISEVKLSPLTGADQSKRGVIITWTTNKEASSQVAYGQGASAGKYNQKSPEDATMALSHTVVLNNLEPGTTYHFQLLSKDKRGNEGKSADYTMLTQEKEESVLDLILSTLEDTFSWVGKIGDWFSKTFSTLFSR